MAWFSFTTTDAGTYIIETHQAVDRDTFDTKMYLYWNFNSVLLRVDDDGGNGLFSKITMSLSGNHTYYVRVAGQNTATGYFAIDAVKPDPPTPTPTPTATNTPTATPTPDLGDPVIRIAPLSLSFPEEAPAQKVNSGGKAAAVNGKNDDMRILLKTGTLETGSKRAKIDAFQSVAADESGVVHVLMQFDELPTAKERGLLEERGIQLLRYIPNNAYWAAVRTAESTLSTATKLDTLRWAVAAPGVDRLDPDTAAGIVPLNARLDDGRIVVHVAVFEDMPLIEADRQVTVAGGEVQRWGFTHSLQVAAPLEALRAIADLDCVEWVESIPAPYHTENSVSSQRQRVDELQVLPYQLNGKDVIVGVWDGGSVYMHTDLTSRLSLMNGSSPVHYHATHVAGTIAGSGAGAARAKGMAPSASIRSYDWYSDHSEMLSGYTAGIRLSNHSYGQIVGWYYDRSKNAWVDWGNSNRFGDYDYNTRGWDNVIYSTGLIVFKSAGNDRNDGPDAYSGGPRRDGPYKSIPPGGNAKNLITIGATEDNDSMSSFSSWGPTDDGRVKPDLCANGVGLYSLMPNNSYASMSGTSMAGPSACGAGALLHQLFTDEMSADPEAETMKALLIHAAKDLGRAGPDYTYGWGLIDAKKSADLILGRMWRTGVVSTDTT